MLVPGCGWWLAGVLGRVLVYGDAGFSGGDFVFGDPFAAFFDALVEVRHPLVAFLCEGFYAVVQGSDELRRVSVFPRRSKTTWQMHSSMRMATALFSAIDNTYMAVPALSCGRCSRADILMREGKKTQFLGKLGLPLSPRLQRDAAPFFQKTFIFFANMA